MVCPYYVGRLEAALGRAEVAERWFGVAADMAERIGVVSWHAQATAALTVL